MVALLVGHMDECDGHAIVPGNGLQLKDNTLLGLAVLPALLRDFYQGNEFLSMGSILDAQLITDVVTLAAPFFHRQAPWWLL